MGTTRRRAERRARKGTDAAEDIRVSLPLELRVDLELQLTDDWGLRADARVTHRWLDTPTVRVGPLQVNVGTKMDAVLAEKHAEIATRIEQQIAQNTSIREKVRGAWRSLCTPRAIQPDGPGAPPAWLVLQPESLFASDPRVVGAELRLTAGLQGLVEVRLTEVLAGDAEVSALPPRREPPADQGLRLHVPIVVPWTRIEVQGTAALAGRTFGTSAAGLEVTGLQAYPSGDQIVVGLSYSAAAPGVVEGGILYVQARAEVDGSVLRLADADYTLGTRTGLGHLDAAAHSAVLAAVGEVELPLQEVLEQARAKANVALTSRALPNGGVLSGRVDTLQVHRVVPTEDGVQVDVEVGGSLRMVAP